MVLPPNINLGSPLGVFTDKHPAYRALGSMGDVNVVFGMLMGSDATGEEEICQRFLAPFGECGAGFAGINGIHYGTDGCRVFDRRELGRLTQF